MLIPFFFLLRDGGMKTSITELLTLLEAMQRGLAGQSVDDFYYLARATLVKDESDLDRFLNQIEAPRKFEVTVPFLNGMPNCGGIIAGSVTGGAKGQGDVLPITLPLIQVNETALTDAIVKWEPRLANLPRPLIAMLIGGPTVKCRPRWPRFS